MRATELEKLLIKNGWNPVRQVGSHKMFKKQNNPHTIALPIHNKDIPIGTLNSILKQAGLK
ncbi:MAG: type II toxin-antitoxin system HicA family toxin [Candidatus Caccovivens sp.]